MRRCFAFALMAVVAAPAGGFAQTGSADRPGADRPAASRDADGPMGDFITRALWAAERHKALLALAQEKAQHPGVKRLAEDLAADLAQSRARLEELARADGRDADARLAETGAVADVPAKELPYKSRQYQRLRALSGAAFDKQFVSGIAISYENAVRRLEAEARDGSDATRRFAADAVTRARLRLDEARSLQEELEAAPR